MSKKEQDGIGYKEGVYNSLSLSYEYDGKQVTNFTARELTLAEMKGLGKLQYKSNHPFQWIAKACCLSVQEMGGVNVYDEYSKNNKIPDIIKAMPMISTNNVLVAGHIETLGEHLEEMPIVCPHCGEKNSKEIDLLTLKVPFIEDETFESKIFSVMLSKGYTPSAQGQKDLSLSAEYKEFTFRLPVLQDLLLLEDSFTESRDLDSFFEALMGQCILKIETEGGEEFPEGLLNMRKKRILSSLSPRDWKKARVTYNKNTPELSVSATDNCSECGGKIEYEMDQNFLFQ